MTNLRVIGRFGALALVVLAMLAGCEDHPGSPGYDLVVENHGDEPVVVTALDDDTEPAFGSTFYVVASGSVVWVRGGVVYDRPAAVFIYDSACNVRRRLHIPSNSPGTYLLRIDQDGSIRLSEVGSEATLPPEAPVNPVPCESPPPG